MKVKSRKGLSNKGLVKYNGKRCFCFIAKHNVESEIIDILKLGTTPFDDLSNRNLGDRIKCDLAIIHSETNKYSQDVKEGNTSTHGIQIFNFSKHTIATIHGVFSSIHNANLKRLASGS